MSDGVLFKRGARWWYDITDASGTRHRKPCGTAERALAEHKLAEVRRALFYGGEVLANTAAGKLTLAAAMRKAMLEHYAGHKDKGGVQKHYDFILSALPSDLRVDQFAQAHTEALLRAMDEAGNANTTKQHKFQSLRKLLGLCAEWGAIPKVPKLPTFKANDGRIRVYTDAEEAAILAWFADTQPAMGDIVVVLLDTGLRLGELVDRQRLVYERPHRMLRVRWSKSGKGRVIPLTPRAEEALSRHLKATPWTDNMIQWEWRKMRASLGYGADTEFVLHALRHTCCTRLIRAGHPLPKVQLWMGHKTIATTLKYTHLDGEDLRPLAASLIKETQ